MSNLNRIDASSVGFLKGFRGSRSSSSPLSHAVVYVKPDGMVLPGVPMKFIMETAERLRNEGFVVDVSSPLLVAPHLKSGLPEAFYKDAWGEAIRGGKLSEARRDEVVQWLCCAHPSRLLPRAPLFGSVLRGIPTSEAKRGFHEALKDIVGDTRPIEAVISGKMTAADSLNSRRYDFIMNNGASFYKWGEMEPWGNIGHRSASQDDALYGVKEIAKFFARLNLIGFLDKDITALCFANHDTLVGSSNSNVISRVSILDVINVLAERNGSVLNVDHLGYAFRGITSGFPVGYAPDDWTVNHGILLMRDCINEAERLKQWNNELVSKSGLSSDKLAPYYEERYSDVSFKPGEKFQLFTVTGTSGVGKSTFVEGAVKSSLKAKVIPIYTDREVAGHTFDYEKEQFSSEIAMSKDEFTGRENDGSFLVVEGEFGVRYAVAKADVLKAVITGGPHMIVCGPFIARMLKVLVNKMLEKEKMTGNIEKPVVTLYLQANEKAIRERLATREKETGRSAKDRVDHAIAVHKKLEEGKDGYDKIISTVDKSKNEVIASAITFMERVVVESGHEIKIPIPSLAIDTDLVRVSLVRGLMAEIYEGIMDPKVDGANFNSMAQFFAEQYAKDKNSSVVGKLQQYLKEFCRLRTGRYPMTQWGQDVSLHDMGTPWHILLTALLMVEIGFSRPDSYSVLGDGLSSLAPFDSESKKGTMLRWWRGLAAMFPLEYRVLLALTHDLGKAGAGDIEILLHDRAGYEGVRRTDFLEGAGLRAWGELRVAENDVTSIMKKAKDLFDKSKRDDGIVVFKKYDDDKVKNKKKLYDGIDKNKELTDTERVALKKLVDQADYDNSVETVKKILELTIKYHHIFGNLYVGHDSPIAFAEMLEDKDVTDLLLLEDTVTVNKAKYAELLNSTLLFTLADTGAHGLLSFLRLEYYRNIRNKMLEIYDSCRGNRDAMIAAIENYSKNHTRERLYAIMSVEDRVEGEAYMDYRPGLDFYSESLAVSLQRAEDDSVSEKHFSFSAEAFLGYLDRVRLRGDFYPSDLARDRRNSDSKAVRNGEVWMHPRLPQFLSVFTSFLSFIESYQDVLQEDEPRLENRGEYEIAKKLLMDVVIVDKNGNYIFSREQNRLLPPIVNSLLRDWNGGFTPPDEDGIIYLTKTQGGASDVKIAEISLIGSAGRLEDKIVTSSTAQKLEDIRPAITLTVKLNNVDIDEKRKKGRGDDGDGEMSY
ncbi:hypothetical protein A2230_03680 [candidate division WOR-1 bacterium RIFOXYA2_FULL_36_21]|uniref:Uncharacterized protein n=1 Tax=candidate division WOR-1 bacterium RIFOXYB2_FULL_36_35 TaxID=1802578 RepID=A0A1F4S1V5_UNCSA|nr:MAG: hypothetical protein A2230_03680 [candidate division WOR-1 bacterium RIFOXYA2_FULL_36_21]OGC14426.1 MAG: hypothetical protein A2290_08375 [candidate division WOR-1 bacterium RIFOXYB2_FULL_36_35]OGC19946.1 MAG: hypothetical protein A2282_01700 [candidate division WOR-1 bacterium RIFOXYA12_FULL_36_13]